MHHQVHAQRVHDAIVEQNIGIARGDLAGAVEEQAVAELHDVGLVHRGHALAAPAPGLVERKLGDARRRHLGDDLDALDHSGHHGVLEPGIQVFGVLADDDQIDTLVARGYRRQVPHRPQVGVEIEGLAQPDIDAGKALAHRCRDRALQRDLVAGDRVEQGLRQRRAVFSHRLRARGEGFPLWRETGRGKNLDDGARDFRADAVARDECDDHSRASQKRSASPPTTVRLRRMLASPCRRLNSARMGSSAGNADTGPDTRA